MNFSFKSTQVLILIADCPRILVENSLYYSILRQLIGGPPSDTIQ